MTQHCSSSSSGNCPCWGCCTAWEPGGASQPIWSCGSHAGLPGEPPASPLPQPTRVPDFEVGEIMRQLISSFSPFLLTKNHTVATQRTPMDPE